MWLLKYRNQSVDDPVGNRLTRIQGRPTARVANPSTLPAQPGTYQG